MTDDRQADTRRAGRAARADQLALGAMLVPLFFVIMFAACIIGTLPQAASEQHQGRRRRAAGADGAAARRPREGGRLGLRDPAGCRPSPTRRTSVRQRDLNAAFVPTANPKQPATVIVASANGRIVATAAETLARAVTAAQGASSSYARSAPCHPETRSGSASSCS